MSDYPTFLANRLDAQEFSTERQLQSDPYCVSHESKYVLADIAAKRATIAGYRQSQRLALALKARYHAGQRVNKQLLLESGKTVGYYQTIKHLCRRSPAIQTTPGDDDEQ